MAGRVTEVMETKIIFNEFGTLVGKRRAAAQRVARTTAHRIQRRAFTLVRKQTWNLANSLVDPNHPNYVWVAERGGMKIDFGTSVFYAGYQEWGTVRNAAHPYFYPSADAEYPLWVKKMQRIYEQNEDPDQVDPDG